MVDRSNYDSRMHVCHKEEKSDSLLKVLGISVGLFFASPMILFFGFFAFASIVIAGAFFFSALHAALPIIILTLFMTLMIPAIRNRKNRKKVIEQLQAENDFLREELLEAKQQILALEEGMEFHRKLENSIQPIQAQSQTQTQAQTRAQTQPQVQTQEKPEQSKNSQAIVAMPATISIAKN